MAISASAIIVLAQCSPPGAQERERPDNPPIRSVARALNHDSTVGFARALAPRPFRFPLDHGPHRAYKQEWWYVTGNLDSDRGQHYGFQLTFFRIALTPHPQAGTSDWRTNQIYMAHFTLSDIADRRFYSFERLSRAAAGLAGASAEPLRVWLEDWSLTGSDVTPTHLVLRLRAATESVAIDLQAESEKPVVLQGDHGLSQKSASPGNASYYYSAPQLRTRGTIRVGGTAFAVSGLSWLDREWSTSALAEDQTGWDWFALQLANGKDLMFYRLRRRDGTADPYSQGMLVYADGSTRRLGLQDVELTVEDRWLSPKTGVRYPSRWRLRVPSAGLELEIKPYLSDQELDLSVRYWEGAVKALGSDHGVSTSASGYVELVGYNR